VDEMGLTSEKKELLKGYIRDCIAEYVTESEGLTSGGEDIKFKKIENGYDVLINGIVVAKNTVRKDYVKSKPTSTIRDKIANVWSITWDIKSLEKALNLPTNSLNSFDQYSPFKDQTSNTRKLDSRDILDMIQRIEI